MQTVLAFLQYKIPFEVFDKFALLISLVVLYYRYFRGYKIPTFYFAGLIGYLPYRLLKENPILDTPVYGVELWQALPVVLFFFYTWYNIDSILFYFINTHIGQTIIAYVFFLADKLGTITEPVSENFFLWFVSRSFFFCFLIYIWALFKFSFWFFWLISTPYFIYKNTIKCFLLDEIVTDSQDFAKVVPEEPNQFNWVTVVAILSIASLKLYNKPVENKLSGAPQSFTYPYIFKRYMMRRALDEAADNSRKLASIAGVGIAGKQAAEGITENDREKKHDYTESRIRFSQMHSSNAEQVREAQREHNDHSRKQAEHDRRANSLRQTQEDLLEKKAKNPNLVVDQDEAAKLTALIIEAEAAREAEDFQRREANKLLRERIAKDQCIGKTSELDTKEETYGKFRQAVKADSTPVATVRDTRIEPGEALVKVLEDPQFDAVIESKLPIENSGPISTEQIREARDAVAPVVEENVRKVVKAKKDALAEALTKSVPAVMDLEA